VKLSFGARLRGAMDAVGPLCVGVDPHPLLLSAWGLPDDAEGLARFAGTCVEALAGRVAAVKPQSAFFERHGSRGIAVLERLLANLSDAGTISLLDVKRGDIGSTMQAYADAYLRDGAPLAADAVTLSPYLGPQSLRPALELAREQGRGVFVLALTSNPEGRAVQHAIGPDGRSVAADVVALAAAENTASGTTSSGTTSSGTTASGTTASGTTASGTTASDLGSVGLVVGATVGTAVADLGLDLAGCRGPLLAPGVGAQGAGPAELRTVFGDARRQVLATSSREVLGAGPSVAALTAAAERTRDVVLAALT
jgi:orotidine-5'-phosphate decarboxylase